MQMTTKNNGIPVPINGSEDIPCYRAPEYYYHGNVVVISSVECLNSTPSQSHIIRSGSISKSSPETKRVSNRQSDYKFSSSVLNILLLSLSLATYHSTSLFLSLPQPHPKLYRDNIMCTGDPVCTEIAGSLLEGLQS